MKKYVMSVITIGLTLLTVLPLVTRLATTDVIAIVINACSAIFYKACLPCMGLGGIEDNIVVNNETQKTANN